MLWHVSGWQQSKRDVADGIGAENTGGAEAPQEAGDYDSHTIWWVVPSVAGGSLLCGLFHF